MREELKSDAYHCNRSNHCHHLPTHLPITIVYFGLDEIAIVVLSRYRVKTCPKERLFGS